MVDFKKLRTSKDKQKVIDPLEIFRRLPKPPGINDLYQSQAEVLDAWFKRRDERDLVVKLHTGGGKTLVGLLLGQSTLVEKGKPVLYLTPTVQLVNQTIAKAKAYGIAAVPYQQRQPLPDEFVNAQAILVATYKALFHGKSKFGVRGAPTHPQEVGAVILDDAHVAFSVVRDSFTLTVNAQENREVYEELTGLFRLAFKEIDRLGTFDDIVSGKDYGVIEVPYWTWAEKLDVVREHLRVVAEQHELVWPLLRDRLNFCHALISRTGFSITPIFPFVDAFATFFESPRRIYMSATIADDSDIIRTFDADPVSMEKPLSSRSLAGVSERMVLIPELMAFEFDGYPSLGKIVNWVADHWKLGTVILVPSDAAAAPWNDIAVAAKGSADAEARIGELQSGASNGPFVFASRYDGIDLPGDSCRLLVMDGLPRGTSDYELFRASAFYGGSTLNRMLAQRVEQGIGRGARGSGDYCVILLVGRKLVGWVAKADNFRFLTRSTRAQLDMGIEVSKEVHDLRELADTIGRSFKRNKDWVEYHAETLAESLEEEEVALMQLRQAAAERKAFNLWVDGYLEKAIDRISSYLTDKNESDAQTRGWLMQMQACIAHEWGNTELAQRLQQAAYKENRNLCRPKVTPPYVPLHPPGEQARAIATHIERYHLRRGFLQTFEEVASCLVPDSSANQFEQALADLGEMLGFVTERPEQETKNGPDVLWLLPKQIGLIIEAKSRKKEKNALTKEQHGQLLVAAEWFRGHYPDFKGIRVSVHPRNMATASAIAGASHALTYEKLAVLIADARSFFSELCASQLPAADLLYRSQQLLESSGLGSEGFVSRYLEPFASATS